MNTTSTLIDGVLYITLAGDLIGSSDAQQLLQAVAEYPHDKVLHCAANLSSIRYINSTSIGALVSLLTKFRSRGGEMVLINPADHLRKALALTKLNNIFTVAADQAAACQQLILAAS